MVLSHPIPAIQTLNTIKTFYYFQVDPDSLGLRQRYGYDTGGGVILDQAWTPPSLSLPNIPLKVSNIRI